VCALFATPAFAQEAEHGGHGDHAHEAIPGEGAEAPGHDGTGAHVGGHGGHGDPTLHSNFFDGIGPNPLDMPYKSQDEAGGPLGDGKLGDQPLPAGSEEPQRSAPFALLVFNFGLVLLILWKWGAPAGRQVAETRSDQIKTALEEAARLRQQAKAKLDEYSSKLKAAEAEITELVAGMRRDAETEKQRIIANAEVQAKALQRDAEERIAAEIGRARLALQREVAVAATTIAEKILRERATAADQGKLVDSFIHDLEGGISAPSGRRA
jgi:F-type H+-transporting ATPase subunit b